MSPEVIKELIKLFLNTYKKKIKSKDDRKQFVSDVNKLAEALASEFEYHPVDMSEINKEFQEMDHNVQNYLDSVEANTKTLINKQNFLQNVKVGQQFNLQLSNGMRLTLPLGIKKSELSSQLAKNNIDDKTIEFIWESYASMIRESKKFDK